MATTQLPKVQDHCATADQDDVTLVAIHTRTSLLNRCRPESEWPRVRGYEVLSVVGSGGMAKVYKARHRDLRRIVAIKTIRSSALTDPEFLDRFYAEAEAVARLQHPNIIQVFEIGTLEPQIGEPIASPFIALEFVEGGCLSTRIGSPQTARESAELVEKLARAAHAAHSLGVIHRDLKPSNVLLTLDGEPKIADFGVAKQLSGERDDAGRYVTQAGTVMGTPEYMAPEQASSGPPTPAVDVYALGVILYEMLTARVPFTAATPLETIDLVRTQEPVSPRQLQPRLPRDLETICLKCLQKDPVRRYQTAQSLADDLRRFLEHRPIDARRVGQVEKVARWAKRNPLSAISVTSVAAIFLAAFVLVTWSYVDSETARKEEAQQRDEAQRREKAERWSRYMADIVAAASAMQVYNVDGASRTLQDTPEEHRNWEWKYFNNRRDLAQNVIHVSNSASEAELSADGRRVVIVCVDGIRVWDVIENRTLVEIPRSGTMAHAKISRDGRFIAYRAEDREVIVHDVDTNKVRGVFRDYDNVVHNVDFTPSGRQLLSGSSQQSARLHDVETGKLLRVFFPDRPQLCICLDASGRTLLHASTQDDFISIERFENGQLVAKIPNPKELLHNIQFNDAGNWILTREFYPRSILRLWDSATGEQLFEMRGHKNSIVHCAYSPDNTRIASGSRDQSIGLWDISTKKPVAMLRGHLGSVLFVAFSPDGKRLVSASEDHTIRIWDAETGDALAVLTGHADEVVCAKYTADGKNIVSASRDGSIRIWNAHTAETNNIFRGHKSFVYSAAFHPNGELVASGSWDGTARIWNATTGREIAVLTHDGGSEGRIVTSVAFHPDGKLLATRSRDGVRLWDVETGKEIQHWNIKNDGWRDTRLAFSRDGKLLATGCFGRVIRIWNIDTRKEVAVLEGHTDGVKDLAFSPDGRSLVSVGDVETRIWDVTTGKQVRTLAGHTDTGLAVAFNADGTVLATSANDNTVRLWNVANWSEIKELKHSTKVYGLAFTSDGTRLAGAGADSSIRFWDLATYQEVADLRGHDAYVHQIAFSPDCTRLISASGDHTLRIWDTLSVQERSKK